MADSVDLLEAGIIDPTNVIGVALGECGFGCQAERRPHARGAANTFRRQMQALATTATRARVLTP